MKKASTCLLQKTRDFSMNLPYLFSNQPAVHLIVILPDLHDVG